MVYKKIRQDTTQEKTRKSKGRTRQDKTRQYKTRQDKTRQDKKMQKIKCTAYTQLYRYTREHCDNNTGEDNTKKERDFTLTDDALRQS